jgi:hypothetical protein
MTASGAREEKAWGQRREKATPPKSKKRVKRKQKQEPRGKWRWRWRWEWEQEQEWKVEPLAGRIT